jgi:hypothetical protein
MEQTLALINQIFELNQKLTQERIVHKFERNFNRLYHIFEEEGYICKDPTGERYTDARTDCTANIAGPEGKEMVITQVIKPIVYQKMNGAPSLVQKGIVIVEKKQQ